jgi:hypothetical protein
MATRTKRSDDREMAMIPIRKQMRKAVDDRSEARPLSYRSISLHMHMKEVSHQIPSSQEWSVMLAYVSTKVHKPSMLGGGKPL